MFFLPILLFVGAAGILSGCAAHSSPPSVPPKTPPPPPPQPSSNPPSSSTFSKSALELRMADGSVVNGYQYLLTLFERNALRSPSSPLPLSAILNGQLADLKIPEIFTDASQAELAKKFAQHLASHDGKPDNVSLYDVYYETKHLYGDEWKENWTGVLLGKDFSAPLADRVRILGAALMDPASPATVTLQSKDLLQSLLTYVNAAPPSAPESTLPPTLDFYVNRKDPAVFPNYLKVNFVNFMKMDATAQSDAFQKAVTRSFPDFETADKLVHYLKQDEALRFIRECFKANPSASLALFERLRLPPWEYDPNASMESEFFPSLPQDAPYAKRKQAIDDFLGTPIVTLNRQTKGDGGTVITTTLKKFKWTGDTEVFSIESPNPGPTTVVFAPHYLEPNPRRSFHWLKDLPLKSGRVIFMPEANRAIGVAEANTRNMNNLFNKAFRNDRVDYLVVRRTEYLLGLVDGLIGLHDWTQHAPFFISDVVVDGVGNAGPALSPTASPWIPRDVKQITSVSHSISLESMRNSPGTRNTLSAAPQVQWQIAEYAAKKLEALSPGQYAFTATPLADRDSYRMDNATAYMNYFLKKPAMTFEGTAEANQGQLAARAVYSLLLAFGHSIDKSFEAKLNDPAPAREPDLYVGLPIPDALSK